MRIEHLQIEQLDEALRIYEDARAFMRRIGNTNQWNDNWPPREVLEADIQKKRLYGVFDGEQLAGVFAYWYGSAAEATYNTIYDGSWLSDQPYGVVHRIAGIEGRGDGREALQWAIERSNGHLRIDTHRDNAAMRHILQKLGFSERGIILLTNGEERIAYEIV